MSTLTSIVILLVIVFFLGCSADRSPNHAAREDEDDSLDEDNVIDKDID